MDKRKMSISKKLKFSFFAWKIESLRMSRHLADFHFNWGVLHNHFSFRALVAHSIVSFWRVLVYSKWYIQRENCRSKNIDKINCQRAPANFSLSLFFLLHSYPPRVYKSSSSSSWGGGKKIVMKCNWIDAKREKIRCCGWGKFSLKTNFLLHFLHSESVNVNLCVANSEIPRIWKVVLEFIDRDISKIVRKNS